MTKHLHFASGGRTYSLDMNSRRLIREKEFHIPLPPRQWKLLTYLVQNPGKLITKSELHDSVWGDTLVEDSAVNAAVRAVREALGDSSKNPVFLETVFGHGFRFLAEVQHSDELKSVPLDRDAPSSPTAEFVQWGDCFGITAGQLHWSRRDRSYKEVNVERFPIIKPFDFDTKIFNRFLSEAEGECAGAQPIIDFSSCQMYVLLEVEDHADLNSGNVVGCAVLRELNVREPDGNLKDRSKGGFKQRQAAHFYKALMRLPNDAAGGELCWLAIRERLRDRQLGSYLLSAVVRDNLMGTVHKNFIIGEIPKEGGDGVAAFFAKNGFQIFQPNAL